MKGKDREQFLMHATRLGLNDYQARKFARMAATSDRLAEAACNGDWPCDNGERKVITCPRCGSGYVKSAMFKDRTAPKIGPWIPLICVSCRLDDRIRAYAAECSVAVDLQGDPRGWTVKLSRLEGSQSCA